MESLSKKHKKVDSRESNFHVPLPSLGSYDSITTSFLSLHGVHVTKVQGHVLGLESDGHTICRTRLHNFDCMGLRHTSCVAQKFSRACSTKTWSKIPPMVTSRIATCAHTRRTDGTVDSTALHSWSGISTRLGHVHEISVASLQDHARPKVHQLSSTMQGWRRTCLSTCLLVQQRVIQARFQIVRFRCCSEWQPNFQVYLYLSRLLQCLSPQCNASALLTCTVA